ncbi:MAG TPA: phosphomannomutase/phosphoglucomutase [Anaeromyxobacteraceae bacterium]|nr:phosphomannomutase/phosphoglucomutase [Anaeromyxobacteraceae bacterium]
MPDAPSPTIFREYDVRGLVDRDLTERAVEQVAQAVGTLVRRAGGRRVVLGRDCRLSSSRLAARAAAGFCAAGVDVVDLGVVPTPLVQFAAATVPADGSCAVTGSHNPPEYNGLKIAVGGTTLHGEAIQELSALCRSGALASGAGTASRHDVSGAYRAAVAAGIRLGARRPKVVVDGGNGTGGPVAVPLLRELGAEVVPLFAEMDGRFPNHHPDPTVEANLAALRARVRETGADVGIAYDGDADRLGAVDERGGVLWGDQLTILFARALLEEHPGAAVVAEAKCSMNLFQDVARRGGRAIMWKAGHSIIRAKMRAEGALLAGEMSGHLFFADRWHGFDDALYASARLVELLSRTGAPLSALLADLPHTFSTPELHLACPEDRKFEVVRRAQAWFSARHETVTVDGVRIVWPDGWGLVRASNTQPLLVLRFEATTDARLREIERYVRDRIGEIAAEVGDAPAREGRP